MSTVLPSELLKTILIAEGVGFATVTADWAIHIGYEPKTPDKVITLFDTGGLPPNPKWLLDYPNVQARIRGPIGGYLAAAAKAREVKDVLLGINSQDVGTDRLVAVNMWSDITLVGYDNLERPMFTANFRLIVQPAANAGTQRQSLT